MTTREADPNNYDNGIVLDDAQKRGFQLAHVAEYVTKATNGTHGTAQCHNVPPVQDTESSGILK